MNVLNKLERKFGRIAIPNLMFLIVAVMLAVYCINLLVPAINLAGWLRLDRALILQGQVWRLITFIFVPPLQSPVWLVFSLYFYYMIGSALEQQWGIFRFNIYYLVGMLGAIISAFLTGYGENYYINMSLFFAFAVLFPDYRLMLFFVIPIKVKYLAVLDAVLFVVSFFTGGLPIKSAIVFSLINFFLFFGKDFFQNIKSGRYYRKNQRNFRNYYNNKRW